ncbi:hypothetical protein ACFX1T_045502 [Malus domestica]
MDFIPMGACQSPQNNESVVEWALQMSKSLNQANFDGILMMSRLYGLQGTLSSGGGGIVNPIPNVVVCHAFNWWQEYLKIMSKPSVSNHQLIISRWSRPPLDYLKINVDGAWNNNSEAGSAVIVIRDSDGCFLGAATRKFAGGSLDHLNFGFNEIQNVVA